MQGYRLIGASLGLGMAIVVSQVLVGAGQSQTAQPIPNTPRMAMAPNTSVATSVTPAQEGWVRNADGTASILLGYQNRNNVAVTIPVGPNNKIEPYGWSSSNKSVDYGQPTYFERGRQYGLWTLVVPKDFGTKRYIWQITINGFVQSILINASNDAYVLAPYFRHDNGNSPPVVKFDPKGTEFIGPPRAFAQTLTASVGTAVPITLYVNDTGNTIEQGRVPAPTTTSATPAATGTTAAAGGGGGRGGRGGGGRGAAAGRGGARGGAPTTAADADQQLGGAALADQANPPAAAAAGGGRGGRGGRGGEEAGEPGCPGGGAGRGGAGGGGGGGVTIKFVKHRGPGDVTFDCSTPPLARDAEVAKMFQKPGTVAGKAVVNAKFSAPGEYDVRAQLSDGSDFRDQCCWTNVHIKVTVK